MFNKFIDRPILSSVISVIILLLGLLGLTSLPISQYPEIAPPTVTVTANYQGANAEVLLSSVVVPLEEQINGVEDMTYMTSSASNEGTATITVYFKLGTNPDLAAVNVQNRVSRATPLLPAEVTRAGVITAKSQSSNLVIFSLYGKNPAFDETFIQNYANINIIPLIKRVPGVGNAMAFGNRDYSMRIWLKPDVMANHKLIPNDISIALAQQNIEAAPGIMGENASESFQYTLKYKGRLKSVEEFGDVIIRATPDGQVLKLKDVARMELGAQSYNTYSQINGYPSVGFAISQTAGSNAKEVISGSLAVLEAAAKNFPDGLDYAILSNANDFLDASISKVITTLIEAFVLVFLVVFLFLQDWRSTLIPAISVPVAIVGTFFFLYLFGFTINLLTLFALVLAVGIVVDDAIVVVEAVHSKLEKGGITPRQASKSAMGEISGAIVSITLVMSAVFVPVSFITGSTGVFYKQFGLTLAISIVLSAINALTLSPALCALLLKPHAHEEGKKKSLLQRFYASFNAAFDVTTRKYGQSLGFLVRHKWVSILLLVGSIAALVHLMRTTPSGFVPNEDMGSIMADIALPVGASMERSKAIVEEVYQIARAIPEAENVLAITGRGMISGAGSNYGMVITRLKKWDQRTAPNQNVQALIGQLFAKTAHIKDARIIFFGAPTLQGFGMASGFDLQLQDKTGGSINEFADIANRFIGALNQRPEIQYASTSFNPTFPQYVVNVDVAKAMKVGLTVNDILSTMQGYYAGVYASNLNLFGKQYRVIFQSEVDYRANMETLNKVMVRTSAGEMAPITEFVTFEKAYGPQAINRFNLFTSISITGAPNPGYSSGDAIKAVEEVAKEVLPLGYGYEYSGITREELAAGSQAIYIFLLCVVFVYLLLAAQYESLFLPMAVLLSVPVGLAGTFIFANWFDVTNNIYLQITLIMLIGLLAKNAILIVEYAVLRRKEGMSLFESAIEGAMARLRPILMTSFAFILGLLPLMLSTGAGAVGNKTIGTGAIGGMLIGTLLGVFIIPVLYVIFQAIEEKFTGDPSQKVKEEEI